MFMFLCANSVQGGFVAVFVFAYADYACIPTHHALSEHEGSMCFLLLKKGAGSDTLHYNSLRIHAHACLHFACIMILE